MIFLMIDAQHKRIYVGVSSQIYFSVWIYLMHVSIVTRVVFDLLSVTYCLWIYVLACFLYLRFQIFMIIHKDLCVSLKETTKGL